MVVYLSKTNSLIICRGNYESKAENSTYSSLTLKQGGNSWFTKEEMTDDLHTVVYHGRLDVHEHSLPVFIVVDDSAFSLCSHSYHNHIYWIEKVIPLC